MRRVPISPRPDWPRRAAELGFAFHTIDGAPYWTEDAAYQFTTAEIDALDDAAQALEETCLDFIAETVERGDYTGYGFDDLACGLIEASWQRQDRNLYGRFDLAFGADGLPKMLEYNADTPTALFEASVVQWEWLEHHFPDCDQFNGLHEMLVHAWRHFSTPGQQLHFACVRDHAEDIGTLEYLRDTAMQAGLDTAQLYMDDIGWNGHHFVDDRQQPIARLFKLYPWEWLLQEEFAQHLSTSSMMLIEPAWKMLLSTKALLPLLWQRFPDHPHLLPASFDRADLRGPCMRKPILGREGDGIVRLQPGETEAVNELPETRWVYQAALDMPCFDGQYPVLGAWVVASRACGLGIREDATPITRNSSRFVPHFFD